MQLFNDRHRSACKERKSKLYVEKFSIFDVVLHSYLSFSILKKKGSQCRSASTMYRSPLRLPSFREGLSVYGSFNPVIHAFLLDRTVAVLDPSEKEEQAMDGTMTVMMNAQRELCGIFKVWSKNPKDDCPNCKRIGRWNRSRPRYGEGMC